jgi:pimeloyl-ACP methyl ester carboxylesterase
MNTVIRLLGYSFLAYAVYVGAMFFFQRHILFPRSLIVPFSYSYDESADLEKTWIELSFGRVEAWLLKPDPVAFEGKRPSIVFAHGNGELIDQWVPFYQQFCKWGISVYLVEYPGYGRSQGNPSQESIRETFVAAYDQLLSRKDIDPQKIILLGRSIGGGAACLLAKERSSSALILMSTFTSVRAMAKRYLIPGFFVRDPFDNLSVVSQYNNPCLIIHGSRDKTIPHSHGRKLASAGKKSRLITYSCGHNDCPPDLTLFWKDIHNFLKSLPYLNV